MKHKSQTLLHRAYKDQSGQIVPWMCFLMVLFLGMAGLTVDVGHAFFVYRELQASTDAAALAGGNEMSLSTATSASVQAVVNSYSSYSTGANANSNVPVTTQPTVSFGCSTYITIPCSASPLGANTLQVKQSASVPTLFIQAINVMGGHVPSALGLTATATAAMKSGSNNQYNVAMVVDTTASMGSNDTDASCNNTRINCALAGVQTMLGLLSPCTAASTSTTCTPFDQVSLFTFPAVEAKTASADFDCSGKTSPQIEPYTTPTPGATWTNTDFTSTATTYQITNYLSDYSSNNKSGGTPNTSSNLTLATNGKSGCSGMQTPGGESTYYAGVIYSALSSLAAQQKANPGSYNALIILSDGDAEAGQANIVGSTKNGTNYGSYQDECQQAITAAGTAKAMTNTTVYTIAYGASSSGGKNGCSTDTTGPLSGISPCTAMLDMATSPADFYSDATASQNKGQCTSTSNPNLTLTGIFTALSGQFTNPRLIPDSKF